MRRPKLTKSLREALARVREERRIREINQQVTSAGVGRRDLLLRQFCHLLPVSINVFCSR
jgi:hypothetical protein